jgi:ribosomal-protein-alanine N-acetyltransferase
MTIVQPLTVERLRKPSPADRDAVLRLEASSFRNPWTAGTFDSMMSTPVSQLYVARAGDTRIVAFCACWVIEDEVHINTIAVDAAVRRQGIATALMTAVLQLTGAGRATLEVRRSNVAAIGLYEKLGFQVSAVRPKYYGDPEEDGLILWMNP